ncbi:MAG: PEGA domain-containing protein [Candidatus Omnitrophica bacterium]|nr:PEGA domain-containing protein [Candidatus Omnitrophota bacterium]
MRLLRRFFFWLLVGLYLIFCPLLIAYALGYIYKPGSELGIVKSGLVYLSTAPQYASVYLGNRRYTRRTPTILPNLLPGEYPLRLTLKGYQSWSESIPIEAGKATVLERILLLPEVWSKKELARGPFEDLIPIGKNRFFILKKGNRAGDLLLYDWKSERVVPLFPETFEGARAKVERLHSVDESREILLKLNEEEGEQYVWVVPRGKEVQMRNVTSLFSEEPELISWDSEERKYIFSFQNGYLNRLDLANLIVTPKFLTGVRGFGFYARRLYVLREDATFERVNLEATSEKHLLDDPAFGKSLFGEKDSFKVYVLSDDLIVFLGENGELLANRLPYRFVRDGVKGVSFDSKSKRLLIWKEDALGIIDFSKERTGKKVFEAGPRLIWAYKQGKEIEQAFWVYDGSHILFRDQHQIYLLELETYGKPHLNRILEVKPESSVSYSEETGMLYGLDPVSGNLSAVEVLPRKEILLLPFPERREEKKKAEIKEL